jgi:hypothetical protein
MNAHFYDNLSWGEQKGHYTGREAGSEEKSKMLVQFGTKAANSG